MLAAVLTQPRTMSLQQVATPRAGPGEVIVRVMANALCGSDVHAFQGVHPRVGLGGWFGHEMSGVVSEVGPGVSSVLIGERVAVDSVLPCRTCRQCRSGHSNRCVNYLTTGSRGDGGLAEQIRLPEANVHRIPTWMSFDAAALVQPLAIAHHAVFEIARVSAGDVVSVIGAGPVGLFVLVLCNQIGATVVVSDPRFARVEMARSLGAAAVADAGTEAVMTALGEYTAGNESDHAFDCVGGGPGIGILQTCAKVTRPGGSVTILGTYSGGSISLPTRDFASKEILVRSSRSYTPESFATCLDLVVTGAIELPDLVSHTFLLEQTQEALTRLDDGDPSIVKAVVRPNDLAS
jgi:threonine dehydrogenase-like Zn-dependent dehydrogenase